MILVIFASTYREFREYKKKHFPHYIDPMNSEIIYCGPEDSDKIMGIQRNSLYIDLGMSRQNEYVTITQAMIKIGLKDGI